MWAHRGSCDTHVVLALETQASVVSDQDLHDNAARRALVVCSFLHPPVTSSLFSPNILLNTLFSNTRSLCFSLKVRDQVSHHTEPHAKL
jgi:hypothetical protein